MFNSHGIPGRTLDAAFFLERYRACVEAHGGKVAVIFDGRQFTYSELDARVRHLAAGLAAMNVGPGTLVAVRLKRSENLLALLLAIWTLRAAYLPIDPAYPQTRQRYVIENAGVKLLISEDNAEALPLPVTVSTLAQVGDAADATVVLDDFVRPASDDLAYLIYTSGSTGNPKGVAISQGNLANFLGAMAVRPGFDSAETLLAVTTISFDIHILELFLPLYQGGQLVLAHERDAMSQKALRRLINQYDIDIMQATPATWRIVLDQGWRPKRPLRILIGGEALPRDLLDRLRNASRELWNMYGPTETTVWSTCALITPQAERITIGTPIHNTLLMVVDDQMQPVSQGITGELLIGGRGVAIGYHNNDQATAEKFIVLPTGSSERMYRTGDLVLQNAVGEIEYVNRLDNQIKIRGFRIEPSEIEQLIAKLPEVEQCVVVAANVAPGDRRLIAFYAGEPLGTATLVEYCKANLPHHFIPQHFVHLEQFPLTDNLKVDRKTLTIHGAGYLSQDTVSSSAARDDIDRSIIATWEKALGVKGIGIDDNFFYLGGHSLLALQLAVDMKKATGIEFSNTLLFEAPTIRTLLKNAGDELNRASSVVLLNEAYGGEPLFCLCGVEIYKSLAECYALKRPVYGVFSKEEMAIIQADKNDQLKFDFELLVQTYVDAILRQGHHPRISLAGFSFGGLLALEVAARLREHQVQVANIVLLDSYIASSVYRSVSETLLDIARAMIQPEQLQGLAYQAKRLLRKIKNKLLGKKDFSKQFSDRAKAFDRATESYKGVRKEYPFNALLIKATHTDFGFGHRIKPDYGLSQFIRGHLAVGSVKSDHLNMLKKENIAEVYRLISEYESGGMGVGERQ